MVLLDMNIKQPRNNMELYSLREWEGNTLKAAIGLEKRYRHTKPPKEAQNKQAQLLQVSDVNLWNLQPQELLSLTNKITKDMYYNEIKNTIMSLRQQKLRLDTISFFLFWDVFVDTQTAKSARTLYIDCRYNCCPTFCTFMVH